MGDVFDHACVFFTHFTRTLSHFHYVAFLQRLTFLKFLNFERASVLLHLRNRQRFPLKLLLLRLFKIVLEEGFVEVLEFGAFEVREGLL